MSYFQGSEKEDPSKISEDPDAILDNFFYDCDRDNTGRVSVSKLIEYLRNAISSGTEEVLLMLFLVLSFTSNYQIISWW